jgi:hypothetical protein
VIGCKKFDERSLKERREKESEEKIQRRRRDPAKSPAKHAVVPGESFWNSGLWARGIRHKVKGEEWRYRGDAAVICM